MAACGGEAKREPTARSPEAGSSAGTVVSGGGSGLPVLLATPMVILPRAAGGGAAGVAAPTALVADDRVVPAPAPFADPGRDAPGVSREPRMLAETPAPTADLAAFARPLAPTQRPAPAFADPAEGEAGDGRNWAKDVPVAEATRDRPVAEATRDGPVVEATRDGPVAEATRDGPVAEATRDGPVAEATRDGLPAEATRDGPPAEATRDGPPAEATRDGPPGEATRDGPPGEAAKDLPIGGTAEDVAVGEAAKDLPIGGTAEDVAVGEAAEDVAVSEAAKDPPLAEAAMELPVSEAAKDLPLAEATKDSPEARDVATASARTAPGEPVLGEPFLRGAPFAAAAPFPAAPPLPAPAPWSALPPPPQRTQGYFGLALRVAGGLTLALAVGVLLLVMLYRVLDPPTSMLMLGQRLSGTPVYQRWVPLERISAYLSQAVILSEDAHFCRHGGVDWGELAAAIENARDGVARGGSTITMQVVKNLFLWPSRSYVRKALEFPLAYGVELAWSKRRILEIYLNIAQWGPGVFGAEAAALYHFRKSAAQLTPREASLLAVSLPNPLQRRPGRPGPGLLRLANHLAMRMHPGVAVGCLRSRQ